MIFTIPEVYNFPLLLSFAVNRPESVKALHCILNLKTFHSSFNTYPVDIELRYPGQTQICFYTAHISMFDLE
jgi:hypothetical protein